MKLKNIVNKDITEVIKKLLYGLDYKTTYLVEFDSECIAKVTEVNIIEYRGNEIIERK